MTKKRENPIIVEAQEPAKSKRPNTLHFSFPPEQIRKLDELAKANNITRAALISIACTRILKEGL